MTELIKLLHEFPAIWLFLGSAAMAVATALWFLIFGRKMMPFYASSIENMTKASEAQTKANQASLTMQKDHYEMEVGYLKDQIEHIKGERDDYKKKLHDEKDAHHNTVIKVAELESRPNVDKVYKGQQEFYTKMVDIMEEQGQTMKAINHSIQVHDEGIEARTAIIIEPVKRMCSEVIEAVKALKK